MRRGVPRGMAPHGGAMAWGWFNEIFAKALRETGVDRLGFAVLVFVPFFRG